MTSYLGPTQVQFQPQPPSQQQQQQYLTPSAIPQYYPLLPKHHSQAASISHSNSSLQANAPNNSKSEQKLAAPQPAAAPVKSRYRTYILSNAVFEVEKKYEVKDIIGHGAYGIVW